MSAVIDASVIRAVYEKWSARARDVNPTAPTGPLAIILGEAVELGMLYQAYWSPNQTNDGETLPSFSEAEEKSALYEELGMEIYELHAAVAKLQADYLRTVELRQDSPMARAEAVLQELKATLEFAFDDDEETLEDEQLESVAAAYPRASSQDVMALALEAYAGLANEHRARVSGLPGFDEALISEAQSLAQALRSRSGEALLADLRSGASDVIDERNRLLTLLLERVQRVRRAARYVFRAYPQIVRNFTSSYERTRRRERRRKAVDVK
jgi:hypothetical protein